MSAKAVVSGGPVVPARGTLQRHVTAGIPKAKLGMGTSFYAICYTGSVTAPNQNTDNGVQVQGGPERPGGGFPESEPGGSPSASGRAPLKPE